MSITEVFDPSFAEDEHVAMIRIQAQDGQESVTEQVITKIETALKAVDPTITFPLVESVGPKVSGELIQTAIIAVAASLAAILFYIWLRFEWQFSVGAVAALAHDVILTIGIFSVLQIRFELATIAALLTIIGYSINDTVVIFDRLRENLIKYKVKPLTELMNLTVNETLSRTIMTSGTTLLALIALLTLGGDVDPRLCVCDYMGCDRRDLFVGLCGEKRGFDARRKTRLVQAGQHHRQPVRERRCLTL